MFNEGIRNLVYLAFAKFTAPDSHDLERHIIIMIVRTSQLPCVPLKPAKARAAYASQSALLSWKSRRSMTSAIQQQQVIGSNRGQRNALEWSRFHRPPKAPMFGGTVWPTPS